MDISVKAGHDVLKERFHLAAEAADGTNLAETAIYYAADERLRRALTGLVPELPPDRADASLLRDRRSALVRAGALIIAEIERIDRAA